MATIRLKLTNLKTMLQTSFILGYPAYTTIPNFRLQKSNVFLTHIPTAKMTAKYTTITTISHVSIPAEGYKLVVVVSGILVPTVVILIFLLKSNQNAKHLIAVKHHFINDFTVPCTLNLSFWFFQTRHAIIKKIKKFSPHLQTYVIIDTQYKFNLLHVHYNFIDAN